MFHVKHFEAHMNVSLYLPSDLVLQLRRLSEEDGRSLSNWISVQLRAVVARQFDTSHPAARAELVRLRGAGSGSQVDLEELTGAVARKVQAGPETRRRQRKGRKPGASR